MCCLDLRDQISSRTTNKVFFHLYKSFPTFGTNLRSNNCVMFVFAPSDLRMAGCNLSCFGKFQQQTEFGGHGREEQEKKAIKQGADGRKGEAIMAQCKCVFLRYIELSTIMRLAGRQNCSDCAITQRARLARIHTLNRISNLKPPKI